MNRQIINVEDIDLAALYRAKVNLLVSYCNTCLDKHQKETILMCQFKSDLLEYALTNNLNEDAVMYYNDLCRLLNIPSGEVCCTYSRCTACPALNRSCCNNCCAL